MLRQVDVVLTSQLDENEVSDENSDLAPIDATESYVSESELPELSNVVAAAQQDDLDTLFEQDHTAQNADEEDRFERFSVVNMDAREQPDKFDKLVSPPASAGTKSTPTVRMSLAVVVNLADAEDDSTGDQSGDNHS